MITPVEEIPTRHILVLTDRDWLHPQGGGTGTNLYGQIARWVAWGHRVTVIAGAFDGGAKVERLSENLTIHRMGSRLTVFPRAAWATWRGLAADADVVLEVINGIAFFTPFWRWLKAPRVPLVHHVHQEHYVTELGWKGRIAAFLLERVPLRHLYRGLPFLTISKAARDDLVALGVQPQDIHVAYLGVEPAQFHEDGAREPEPMLLYLGRLKAYKRIEVVLDVLEAIPGARLEIAGAGDHRPVLEEEIRERGLAGRVLMHGFVDEDDKAGLYSRAWVSLTASSAEGWCLTVMEAAACGTPSAALRVGGLGESIVDGETGILAGEPEELRRRVAALVADRPAVDELGEAARARARGFTWEHTAEANLSVLNRAALGERPRLRDAFAQSDTAKAASLAAATLGNNVIQLLFTVVFTRLLGANGYGSLAALISAFLILLVAGSAVQVAAAREAALGRLGSGPALATTMAAWTRRLAVGFACVTAASILLRVPIGHLVGVPEHPWAAAAILPTGALWVYLSLQRGVLQGLQAYAPMGSSIVAEAGGRLVFGLLLWGAGLGVTGAYLGTPLAFLAVSAWLAIELHRRTGAPAPSARPARTLTGLVGLNWGPVLGLTLLAVLQNVDVIVVKHRLGGDAAGSYAAAAVAAKAVIWVAIGISLHLLPEATRRAAAGVDPRPVLMRALGIVVVVAAPALLIFAAVPDLLLRLAFGAKFTEAAGALVLLGAAMTLLALAYLTVQYMIALGRTAFLWVLGIVAVAEPFLLSAGSFSLLSFAAMVLGLQCIVASAVLALGLRTRTRTRTRTA
jgi:glycosyltransferase involved in cell wall biosynthesis/O-antigen/teichoic acid export membrane protein